MQVAQSGAAILPARTPQALLEKIYDYRARDWDLQTAYRGHTLTAQALRAGRPMLVVPFAHDQFDNAALHFQFDYIVAI